MCAPCNRMGTFLAILVRLTYNSGFRLGSCGLQLDYSHDQHLGSLDYRAVARIRSSNDLLCALEVNDRG